MRFRKVAQLALSDSVSKGQSEGWILGLPGSNTRAPCFSLLSRGIRSGLCVFGAQVLGLRLRVSGTQELRHLGLQLSPRRGEGVEAAVEAVQVGGGGGKQLMGGGGSHTHSHPLR